MEKAVIIDLDGTLVNNNQRALESYLPMPEGADPIKHWEPFFEESLFDLPNDWCMEILSAMSSKEYRVIFLTGRSATDRTIASTQKWLDINVHKSVKYDLFMRPVNDERRDNEVKEEIISSSIIPYYDVLFAIDDKRSNVDMFEKLGIKCLHCADY